MLIAVLRELLLCCVHRFHVNSGVDGSSLSSPLDSPDVPITSSVATLQSAESLSIRRQVRLAELSSGHYGDLLDPVPHTHALKRPATLTVPAMPSPLVNTPDTPSAKVTPSLHSADTDGARFTTSDTDLPKTTYLEEPPSPSAILTPSSESPEAVLSNPEDLDLISFYDEFWEMTYFEHDLRCISIHDFNNDADLDDSSLGN